MSGESLLVQGREFPPPRGARLSVPNLLVASSLFVAFLFAGEAGSGWTARALVIFGAAAAGYGALWLRRRMGDDG